MIKDIPFTCYPVSDIAKSREFYEEVLGLKPSDEYGTEGPFIEYLVGSGCFSIGKMDDWQPSGQNGPSAAFEVDNLDEMIAMLKEKGIAFMMEKEDFPSCAMAIIFDPDHNAVTLHQKK